MPIRNLSQETRSLLDVMPGAIEHSEAQGQQQLAASSQLPIDCLGETRAKLREKYKELGIEVVGPSPGDDLFFDVRLPEGMIIRPTEHSMHSDLVDADGKVVAGIFYKAAFYDRKAHISFTES